VIKEGKSSPKKKCLDTCVIKFSQLILWYIFGEQGGEHGDDMPVDTGA